MIQSYFYFVATTNAITPTKTTTTTTAATFATKTTANYLATLMTCLNYYSYSTLN